MKNVDDLKILDDLISLERQEALMQDFREMRELQLNKPVYGHLFSEIEKIWKSLEVLRDEGWIDQKIYEETLRKLIEDVHGLRLAKARFLKREKGRHTRDFALDCLLWDLGKIIEAAGETGKSIDNLVGQFLIKWPIRPLRMTEGKLEEDSAYEWKNEKQVGERRENVDPEKVEVWKHVAQFEKTGTDPEFTVWPIKDAADIMSANPGVELSELGRKLHDACHLSDLDTKTSKPPTVGSRAK